MQNSEAKEVFFHRRIVFSFSLKTEDDDSYNLLDRYSVHCEPGNMKKAMRNARSALRAYLRKYSAPVCVDYYAELYKIIKTDDLPNSYVIDHMVTTEYLGQISVEEFFGIRHWYWSYWCNGDFHYTHWRKEDLT